MVHKFLRLLKWGKTLFACCLLLFGIAAAPSSWAGSPYPKTIFEHLSVQDGLSQSSVLCIAQDTKGFMWFGTRNGLNRFNGHKFEVFVAADSASISNSYIHCLAAVGNGNLWVGTDQGLNYFDAATERFFHYFPSKEQAEANRVLSVFPIDGDRLLVGTALGLFMLHIPSATFSRPAFLGTADPVLRNGWVTDISQDQLGRVWIGTDEGLFRTGREMAELHPVPLPGEGQPRVSKVLHRPHTDTVWVATYGQGLYVLSAQAGEVLQNFASCSEGTYCLSDGRIRDMVFDQKGQLWIGTFEGLNTLEPDHGRLKKHFHYPEHPKSLSHNSVRALFLDRQGSVWIGTYSGGINLYSSDLQRFRHFYQLKGELVSLRHNVVSSFAQDSAGQLWIGSERGGISLFDPQGHRFLPLGNEWQGFGHGVVKALLYGQGDRLWIGTHAGGLSYRTPDGSQIVKVRHPEHPEFTEAVVNCLYQDSSGFLWIGTDRLGGLHRYHPASDRFIPSPRLQILQEMLRNVPVSCIMASQDGKIWLGTEGLGLLSYDPNNGEIRHYWQQPLGTNITALLQDGEGVIWIGSYGNGVACMQPRTQEIWQPKAMENLPNQVVFGLLQDAESTLWVSTLTGLLSYRQADSTFARFGKKQGMHLNEVNEGAFFMSADGRIWCGGNNGFVVFDPTETTLQAQAPPVVLTDFALFGQSVPIGVNSPLSQHISETEKVSLQHDQNIFTISFALLDYTYPLDNRYRYRLIGLEEDWNMGQGQMAVNYSLQNHGEYRFEVQAASPHGQWGSATRSLEIEMLPPPWKAWWAYTTYVSLVLGAVLLMRHYATKNVQIKGELKLEQLKHERQTEINQAKIEFFTNISHEIRTPLSLIIGPAEELLKKRPVGTEGQMLVRIYENAKRLHHLLNHLMDFRKAETGGLQPRYQAVDMGKIGQNVLNAFRSYAQLRGIRLRLSNKLEGEGMPLKADPQLMESLLYNLLSNALKFTPDQGKVKATLTQTEVESFKGAAEADKWPEVGFSALPEPKGKALLLIIEDTGQGIGQEALPHIFDRFYQASEGQQTHAGGTGIGLALVKSIVEAHKGKLLLQSKQGEGSKISVLLPFLHQQEVLATSAPPKKGTAAQLERDTPTLGLTAPGTPVRHTAPENAPLVFLADDQPEVLAFLTDLLGETYRLSVASNGEQAWERVRKGLPQLVLSDVMMPGIDGIQLCKKIKSTPATSHIPVILLTALTAEEARLQAFQSGADDYLTKPFQTELLRTRVAHFLQLQNKHRATQQHRLPLALQQAVPEGPDAKLLQKINQVVSERINDEALSVQELGNEVGMSRVQLYRKVKLLTGLSPVELIRGMRLDYAAFLLRQHDFNVAEVAFMSGFRDKDYFSKQFRERFEVTPSAYRKGQQDGLPLS